MSSRVNNSVETWSRCRCGQSLSRHGIAVTITLVVDQLNIHFENPIRAMPAPVAASLKSLAWRHWRNPGMPTMLWIVDLG